MAINNTPGRTPSQAAKDAVESLTEFNLVADLSKSTILDLAKHFDSVNIRLNNAVNVQKDLNKLLYSGLDLVKQNFAMEKKATADKMEALRAEVAQIEALNALVVNSEDKLKIVSDRLNDIMGQQMNPSLMAEMNELLKQKTELNDFLNLNSNITAETENRLSVIKNMTSELQKQQATQLGIEKAMGIGSGFLEKIGISTASIGELSTLIKAPWTMIIVLLELALNRFLALEAAAEEFRKTTGFGISQMKELRRVVEGVNLQYESSGVSIEKAYSAASALSKEFTTLTIATRENVQFTALMAANLGVSEENTAKVLSKFMGLGKMSASSSRDMMRFAKSISTAAGVPLNVVMGDVANASQETMMVIGMAPEKLLKAATHARMIGIEMGTAAANSRKMLNFNESIDAELEASVLLGKNLNFMSVRRLAFEGKIVESQQEALRIVEAAGDLDNMNVLQREALVKASGMDLSTIQKMKAQKEAMLEIERTGTPEMKKQLELMKAAEVSIKTTGELAKDELKAKIAANIEAEKSREMFSDVTAIGNSVKGMVTDLGAMFAPIFKPVMKFLNFVFSIFGLGIKVISTAFRGFLSLFDPLLDVVSELFEYLTPTSDSTAFLDGVYDVFASIGKAAGWVGDKIGGVLLMVWDGWKGIWDLGVEFLDWFADIPDKIEEFLVSGFRSAYDWISSIFSGNSPSQLGEEILLGIQSIGSGLIDALIYPFQAGWEFISGLFSSDGKFVEMIKMLGSLIVDVLLAPFKAVSGAINWVGTKLGIISPEPATQTTTQSDSGQSTTNNQNNILELSQKLDRVVASIEKLTTLMANGGISVNLDGRRVSQQLSVSVGG